MNSHQLNANIPYATDDELDLITSLCRGLRQGDEVVMIGAGPGVMLLAAREGGVDFPITVIDNQTTRYAEAHLNAEGLGIGVYYVLGDSKFIGNVWTGRPVSLLIVDGDHSYNGVRGDLKYWLPHVQIGGYIFLHDYDARGTQFERQEQYPGVAQAIAESELVDLTKWEHYGQYGTGILFARIN